MGSVPFNKGQNAGKEKKKQVKDELDRLKQAEKKKRRLEKALATSAAIISELEKKKLKKNEEQRRLDEEGAAIAEAVALHVLLGEDSDDSCKVVIDDNGRKTWNCNHNLDLFMAEKRACFPHLDGEWSFSSGSFEKNVYEPLYEEAGWGTAGFSVDLIAAQAARSLQIADEDRILL
ncbi:PREDICTED: uncharacterized protein LOC109353414 isoform X2 [Lupinus angustifolius]|uniref:uncharacterized protein LOC109353414 isoform X2 n=1 Tax=Lupinus angustifolius TaxID=3871 RepID=UPI00092EB2A3|nr:PREDICTED: uncharacterized protein LOC109353414 isoform X2 [Lupinus angustifolius]